MSPQQKHTTDYEASYQASPKEGIRWSPYPNADTKRVYATERSQIYHEQIECSRLHQADSIYIYPEEYVLSSIHNPERPCDECSVYLDTAVDLAIEDGFDPRSLVYTRTGEPTLPALSTVFEYHGATSDVLSSAVTTDEGAVAGHACPVDDCSKIVATEVGLTGHFRSAHLDKETRSNPNTPRKVIEAILGKTEWADLLFDAHYCKGYTFREISHLLPDHTGHSRTIPDAIDRFGIPRMNGSIKTLLEKHAADDPVPEPESESADAGTGGGC